MKVLDASYTLKEYINKDFVFVLNDNKLKFKYVELRKEASFFILAIIGTAFYYLANYIQINNPTWDYTHLTVIGWTMLIILFIVIYNNIITLFSNNPPIICDEHEISKIKIDHKKFQIAIKFKSDEWVNLQFSNLIFESYVNRLFKIDDILIVQDCPI
jgi:hypothetical protein